jgi:alanyl-tRNA synthetase
LLEWTQSLSKKTGATKFKGYDSLTVAQQKPLGLSDGTKSVSQLAEGQSGIVVFAATPFYAEGGGQTGDQGEITDGQNVVEVYDCTKMNDLYLHHITVKSGKFSVDQPYNINVQNSLRRDTARNHSATHLLHAALKTVLGDKVAQAGSQVGPEKLRFDFNHNAGVTPTQLSELEDLVNEQIYLSVPVQADVQSYKEAVKNGAVAMFGEKYGDEVRVLSMGSFSKELCGGTHVQNTSEIGLFKIVSESSVSAGVRRIEALTGRTALAYLKKNTAENMRARKDLNLPTAWDSYLEAEGGVTVDAWIAQTQDTVSQLKKQVQGLQSQNVDFDSLVAKSTPHAMATGEVKLLVEAFAVEDRSVLSEIVDRLRDRAPNLVVVVVGAGDTQKPFLIACNKNLKSVVCGNIAKELTQKFGGKGGGRPDYAQGSFETFDSKQALEIVKTVLK